VETSAAYLERKHRELALIDACLATPLQFDAPESAEAMIERKFKLAGALRAERSLESWAITETARPEAQRWRSGAYRFSYEYQRADLHVRGPAIYDVAGAVDGIVRQVELVFGPAPEGEPQDAARLSDGLRSLFYFALVGALFDLERESVRAKIAPSAEPGTAAPSPN
jgi:hypothetical protein